MARVKSRPAAATIACALVAWGILAALASATARADTIFAVFENPKSGAPAVKGVPADAAMARQGALEIDTIEFGIENDLVIDPEVGAVGPGRASFRTLRMALPLGPGVAALLQASGAGGHYGDVTVHFRKDGKPADYATLSLKVAAVSSVEVSASAGHAPQATVELTYGSMKLASYAQAPNGQLAGTPEVGQWNAMTGTADYATIPKP